jgi:DNA gyrase subunit A
MIRVPVEGIRISGRNTQGVKVMNLGAGDLLVDVARVVKEDEDENGAGEDDGDEVRAAPAKASGKGARPAKRPGRPQAKKKK